MFNKLKPVKEKAAKDPAKQKKPVSVALKAAVAALLGLVLFVVLLAVEKSAVTPPPTVQVVAAIADVPAKLTLSAENVSQYFSLLELPETSAPAAAVTKVADLVGLATGTAFTANEVATPNRFDSLGTAQLTNPVEVAVSVSASAYADGGRIRAGDRVNIGYIAKAEDGSGYMEVLQDVLVVGAMDSSGAAAVSAGDGVVATMFALSMDKADATIMYSKIELGNVVIQKVN